MPSSPAIAFTPARYESLRRTYRRWWSGALARPIVPIVTAGHAPLRAPSMHPVLHCSNSWDFSIEPEQFIDAQDALLSTLRFHGDAFPYLNTDAFGPGVLAAFLGCTPVNAPSTVWFRPPKPDMPIESLHFEYDEHNPYFQRVLRFYEAAMDRWHGRVVVGMVDMGGILDVLSSFRGTQNLLMDLYDAPDEVLRCIRELHALWFAYFDRINAVLSPEAEGYSDWFGLYGEQPGYILQSDFSYMISPDMFRTFVAPELTCAAERLHHAIYHLDGVGEIPHLDALSRIDAIHGIQWVHGDGEPALRCWDELLLRILASGKKLLSLTQNGDGTPIALARDPGQLYLPVRRFAYTQLNQAKAYAALYGMDL